MADVLKAYWQSFGLSVRAVNCLMFIQMPDAQGLAIVGQKNFARRADAGDKTIDEIWDRVFPGHGLAALKKWFTEYRGEALFRLRTIEATLWCKLDQPECRRRRRARQLRLCRH